MLPTTCIASGSAPIRRKRRSSDFDCAAIRLKPARVSRVNLPKRAYPRAERADRRAFTKATGIPCSRADAMTLGQISVSTMTISWGCQWRKKAPVTSGVSNGNHVCSTRLPNNFCVCSEPVGVVLVISTALSGHSSKMRSTNGATASSSPTETA